MAKNTCFHQEKKPFKANKGDSDTDLVTIIKTLVSADVFTILDGFLTLIWGRKKKQFRWVSDTYWL